MKTKSLVSLPIATGNGSERSHNTISSAIFGSYGSILAVFVTALEMGFCIADEIPSFDFPHPDNSTLHDSTVREVNPHIKKRKSVQVWNTGQPGLMLKCQAPDSHFARYSTEGNYHGLVNQYNRRAIASGETNHPGVLNFAVLS